MIVKFSGTFCGFTNANANYDTDSLKEAFGKIGECFNKCSMDYDETNGILIVKDLETTETTATLKVAKQHKLLVNIQTVVESVFTTASVEQLVKEFKRCEYFYIERSVDWVKLACANCLIYVYGDFTE